MRSTIAVLTAAIIIFCGVVSTNAEDRENELVNRFLDRTIKEQTRHLGWASVNFSLDRINRENDYNRFANYTSNHFPGAQFSWLGEGKSLGADVGLVFKERFSWSVGGEYWLKMGEAFTGTYTYSPPLSTSTTITDPKSEISVLGFSTGLWYYPFNHPTPADGLKSLSIRFGGTVGYYMAIWDLWEDYESINMTSSETENSNISFKGSTLGFSANIGADYPLNLWGLSLGADVSYQVLNFKNIAWYNTADEAIVATYDGSTDGRVNLDFTGIRGKIELKHFFGW